MPRPQPSAPKFEDVVGSGIGYSCEQGCDVVFLVGYEDQVWRLPAVRRIIQNATPVFRAMFSEYFAPQQAQFDEPYTIRVTDVEGRAFDNLLRFLYDEDVIFQSVETALPLLFAAHKYQCPGLVQHCIDYLKRNVSTSNVLQILSTVPLLCGNVQNLENCGRERQMIQDSELLSNPHGSNKVVVGEENLKNYSQPSDQISSSDSQNLDSIETECASLLQACLRFVDTEATAILSSDEMEDLDWETIRLILFRDTLDITDENLVFTAILKWADKECKRQQKQLTSQSKREVLGELLFLPRYLTMSLHSFQSDHGPAKSGLFTQDETKCLTTILKKRIKIADIISPPSSPCRKSSLSLEIPSSLRPYCKTIAKPRCPPSTMGFHGSPGKKSRKGWSLIELLKNRRCCCRNKRSSNQQRSHSNNSSQYPSPANSNPSSPLRSSSSSRNHQSKQQCSVALERFVVFLACVFD